MSSINLNNENTIAQVEWTAKMLKEFKSEYKKALENKQNIIVFKGQEYVTMFGKYLIEYLEPKFK